MDARNWQRKACNVVVISDSVEVSASVWRLAEKPVKKRTITVNDRMQSGYKYELSAATGRSFDAEFKPQLTPREMLRLGVFGGKYMTDCRREFPRSWFVGAKFAKGRSD